MRFRFDSLIVGFLLVLGFPGILFADEKVDARLLPLFSPPAEFSNDLGSYRSPLEFEDGRRVTNAADWQLRRQEILKTWHDLMGPWPLLLEKPKLQYLAQERRDNLTQQHVRIEIAPGQMTDDAYLLVPDGDGPFPAVLVVYYDAKTGAGLGKELRDFGYQLARRGFVTLSLGGPAGRPVPVSGKPILQPLSYNAYVAANCHTLLANLPHVDGQRVGVPRPPRRDRGAKWRARCVCRSRSGAGTRMQRRR